MCERSLTNDLEPEPPPALECPQCGEFVFPGDSKCDECGYDGPEVNNTNY